MSTVRAFFDNKRIATGRMTKDGRFFQAYPIHQFYVNENAWRDEWMKKSNVNFVIEGATATTPVEKPYEFSKNTSATLPAGRYYIGDICYVMKEYVYNHIFGDTNYEPGHYKTANGEFLVNRTAYGDGSYPSSNNYSYCVDAGIIGIASMDVCMPEDMVYGGTLHTFTDPVKCSFKNGRFEFSSGSWYLEIDTV